MKTVFLCIALLATTLCPSPKASAEIKNGLKPAAKPNEMIPVRERDVRIIHRASQILDSESKWNRKDDRECPSGRHTFSLYCALYKASVEINGEFDHRLGALEEVRRAVEVASKGKNYEHRLMGYNNDRSTTFGDIKKVLKETEERIAMRLNQNKH